MNAAACELWNQLIAFAKEAMASSDKDVAAAGTALNSTLRDIWDAKATMNLSVGHRSWLANWAYGGGSTKQKVQYEGVGANTDIDSDYASNKYNMSNVVVLAHEAGHARAIMTGDWDNVNNTSVETENNARKVKHCTPRKDEFSNPPACR
jgi:hypothetical protein